MFWKYRHKHHYFFHYSYHEYNYINNDNEASDAYYDSNSDGKLLETYLSDKNDLHISGRGNHTNNEDNDILDDDNIKNF